MCLILVNWRFILFSTNIRNDRVVPVVQIGAGTNYWIVILEVIVVFAVNQDIFAVFLQLYGIDLLIAPGLAAKILIVTIEMRAYGLPIKPEVCFVERLEELNFEWLQGVHKAIRVYQASPSIVQCANLNERLVLEVVLGFHRVASNRVCLHEWRLIAHPFSRLIESRLF